MVCLGQYHFRRTAIRSVDQKTTPAGLMKIDGEILKQLQNGIAAGDQRSFEDLYRLFFARLFNFALLFVHKKEIAEEAVNDVMMKVWKKRETLTAIKNLETYLFVAVRNQSLNYLSQYS